MDLNKLNISDLNTDEIMKHLIPYEEDGRAIFAKFAYDDKPLIKYFPAIEHETDEIYDGYRNNINFEYLKVYNYDVERRLIIAMSLSKWAMSNLPTGWMYDSSIKYKYLQKDNPRPTQVNMSNGFWVANKYDNDFNLIQSVTSNGATLLQLWDSDGYLMTKLFRIITDDESVEYKFTFGLDPTEFIEYEDSYGNFWNVKTGYPCPYENPVKIQKKDFLEDNEDFYLYN